MLKMYSLSASSERRMRVSLTRVMPLTATVGAGVASDTTSATLVLGAAEEAAGSGAAGATGAGDEVVASEAALGGAAVRVGASFFATMTGSGLLGRMLLIGMPAEGLDLAATVSTFAGAAAATTGCATD